MNSPEEFVAALTILTIFGLPVAAFVVFRILAHRERMEMIRHGMAPGKRGAQYRGSEYVPFDPSDAQVQGRRGGRGRSCDDTDDPQTLLRKGIKLAFIGLALSIGLSFIGFNDDGPWHLGPWMLGGLIPLFIGLAQIATAYVSDPSILARFIVSRRQPGPGPGYGNPMPPPRYGSGNGNAGGSATSAGGFEGSYTYRPDGTQELRPPTPPPERRP